MSIPNYTTGYPPDGSSLGNTKAIIRNNLDGTFETLSVDHQNQNQANPGYHKDIHMIPQGSVPGAIAGINQLFALNVTPTYAGATPDTQLFSFTGGGGLSQLTGYHASTQGWAWTGGILFQWGIVNFSNASKTENGNVRFQGTSPPSRSNTGINFPVAAFAVTTGWIASSTGVASSNNTLSVTGLSTTQFNWVKAANDTTSYTGFYWIAIGI